MSRSEIITSMLEDYGIDPGRFQINWVSSAEPDKFVAAVKELTDRVKRLGPMKTPETEAEGG